MTVQPFAKFSSDILEHHFSGEGQCMVMLENDGGCSALCI